MKFHVVLYTNCHHVFLKDEKLFTRLFVPDSILNHQLLLLKELELFITLLSDDVQRMNQYHQLL